MTIYQDPAGPYPRPTLLPALMSVPAKEGQHQHENQATEILAWLVDRSDAVAHAVTELFLGHLPPARRPGPIGARTQLSLPRPGGRTVYPDLSIDGPFASFQLLVEVKIAADLSETLDETGLVRKQDELYRQAWKAQGTDGQAAVRAVGTLTRPGGDRPIDLTAMQAREVSWSALHTTLAACVPRCEVAVREVLTSFVQAIDVHIAVQPLDLTAVASWLERHAPLVATTARLLAEQLGARADTSTKVTVDYASKYVRFTDSTGQEMRVRVFATPANGRLNLPGHPDALAVYLGRDSDATLEPAMIPRLQAAGFVAQKDIWGFKLCRRHYEIPTKGDVEQLSAVVAEQVAAMLRSADLVPAQASDEKWGSSHDAP